MVLSRTPGHNICTWVLYGACTYAHCNPTCFCSCFRIRSTPLLQILASSGKKWWRTCLQPFFGVFIYNKLCQCHILMFAATLLSYNITNKMFVRQITTRNICHHLVLPSYHFCFVRFIYHFSIILFYVIISHPIHPRGICKVMSLYTITISTLNETKPALFGSKSQKIKMFDKFTVTIRKKIPSLRIFLQSVWKRYTTYSDANGISRSRKVFSGT